MGVKQEGCVDVMRDVLDLGLKVQGSLPLYEVPRTRTIVCHSFWDLLGVYIVQAPYSWNLSVIHTHASTQAPRRLVESHT